MRVRAHAMHQSAISATPARSRQVSDAAHSTLTLDQSVRMLCELSKIKSRSDACFAAGEAGDEQFAGRPELRQIAPGLHGESRGPVLSPGS